MTQLFISYSYIAKTGQQIYQGFGNMIQGPHVYGEPSETVHVEELHNVTNEHCKAENGFETASTTVLFWRLLDADS